MYDPAESMEERYRSRREEEDEHRAQDSDDDLSRRFLYCDVVSKPCYGLSSSGISHSSHSGSCALMSALISYALKETFLPAGQRYEDVQDLIKTTYKPPLASEDAFKTLQTHASNRLYAQDHISSTQQHVCKREIHSCPGPSV